MDELLMDSLVLEIVSVTGLISMIVWIVDEYLLIMFCMLNLLSSPSNTVSLFYVEMVIFVLSYFSFELCLNILNMLFHNSSLLHLLIVLLINYFILLLLRRISMFLYHTSKYIGYLSRDRKMNSDFFVIHPSEVIQSRHTLNKYLR